MGNLTIHWNYIDCYGHTDLAMSYRPEALEAGSIKSLENGCRGVLFRAVYTEEPDFSSILDELKLEDVRRERNVASQSLLFCPKMPEEKSIGTIRIIRPKRLVKTKEYDTCVERTARRNEYDVLLESTEFILEEVQEQMAERFQLQETFGDSQIFFFGKRAEIYTYSGSLFNGTGELQWRNQFLRDYDEYLRGTRCAEIKARAYLLYDDVIREGFILSAGLAQNSVVEGVVKFTFTMVVTGKRVLGSAPTRKTGTLVGTAENPNNKNSVDKVIFIRSVSPNLAGVAVLPTAKRAGSSREVTTSSLGSTLIQNNALPGTEAPGDLQGVMESKARAALSRIGNLNLDEATFSETAVDHDILVDFINAKQLMASCRDTMRAITGGGTLDISGLTGDALVSTLLSDPSKVADLSLGKAVEAADSFTKSNTTKISAELSASLKNLVDYLSPNASARVTSRVQPPVLFDSVIPGTEKKEYALEASLDSVLLKDLINSTASLRDLDPASIQKQIINSVTVSFIPTLIGNKNIVNVYVGAVHYVAAFCLIKDPSGSLFPAVTNNLSQVDTLGGKENAILYVNSQKSDSFASAVGPLTEQVNAKYNDAVKSLTGSSLYSLMASRTGRAVGTLPVTEYTMHNALDPVPPSSQGANLELMNFLARATVFVDSIVTEVLGQDLPVTVDATGGHCRFPMSIDKAGDTYFKKGDFVDKAKLNTELNHYQIAFTTNDVGGLTYPIVGSDDKYLELPFSSVSSFVRFRNPDNESDFGFVHTPEGEDEILYQNGIVRVPGEMARRFLANVGSASLPKIEITYVGMMRRLSGYITGNVTKGSKDINFPAAQFGAIVDYLKVARMPISQNHLGGSAVKYNRATTDGLALKMFAINSLIKTYVPRAVEEARNKLGEYMDSGKYPQDDATKEKFLKELALDNFLSVADISQLNTALRAVGVETNDVYTMFMFAKKEQPMAKKLAELQQKITDAINEALRDARGEAVKQSDSIVKEATCGQATKT